MTVLSVPAGDIGGAEVATAWRNAPVECLTMPAVNVGYHDVLRCFDVLRRRISMRLRGAEGSFAGYSRLEFSPIPVPPLPSSPQARLTCVAVLVSATGERQGIRFEAFVEPDDAPYGQPSSRSVRIAAGDGLVVAFR